MHPAEIQLIALARAFEPAMINYLKARTLHTAATLELKKAEDALFSTGGGALAALLAGFANQPGARHVGESAASVPETAGEERSEGYSMAELGEPTEKLELVRWRGQEVPRRAFVTLFEHGGWRGTLDKHVFEGSPESVATSLRLAAWGEKGNA